MLPKWRKDKIVRLSKQFDISEGFTAEQAAVFTEKEIAMMNMKINMLRLKALELQIAIMCYDDVINNDLSGEQRVWFSNKICEYFRKHQSELGLNDEKDSNE